MSAQLAIVKATLDLYVYVDGIVKNQDLYHTYGIGVAMGEAFGQRAKSFKQIEHSSMLGSTTLSIKNMK